MSPLVCGAPVGNETAWRPGGGSCAFALQVPPEAPNLRAAILFAHRFAVATLVCRLSHQNPRQNYKDQVRRPKEHKTKHPKACQNHCGEYPSGKQDGKRRKKECEHVVHDGHLNGERPSVNRRLE